MLRSRRLDERRRIAVLERHPPLRDVVEVGEKPVELFLRKQIVLVVVAARASERQPQPHGGRGIDAIDHVFHRVLLGNDAAFPVAAVIAVEAGGDLLVERGVGQHVAGDLLDGELVEGQVAVEGLDHPIAPAPHAALAVGLVAVGVGVARRIEPARGHALAVAWRLQQPVDNLFVIAVAQKGVHFRQGRRNAGEVERHAANQQRRVGFGRRRQSLAVEPLQHKRVHRIADPLRLADARRLAPLGRNEGPVLLPDGALGDPVADQADFALAQRYAGVDGGHAQRLVLRGDAPHHLALAGIAGHDGEVAAQICLGAGLVIESQLALAIALVGAVAGIALVGENRPDVAIEFHRSGDTRPG